MFWKILVILGILLVIVIGIGLFIGGKILWEELMGDDEDEGFYSQEIAAGANDQTINDKH
jgi:hypothetical protein